jgi:hypothetical protein
MEMRPEPGEKRGDFTSRPAGRKRNLNPLNLVVAGMG